MPVRLAGDQVRGICGAIGIVILFLGAIGCSRTPASPSGGARTNTVGLTSNGSCSSLNVSGGRSDTVFVVLGLLEEYQGRYFVEDSDGVERFYCNEPNIATLFRRLIVRLAGEQGLDATIRDETIQQCLVSYHSKAIGDALNSCYRYALSSDVMARAADGTYRRTANASLDRSLFLPTARVRTAGQGTGADEDDLRRRALAYLAGAWIRYGNGTDFIFANAHDKAALVSVLLTHLGCRDVHLESITGIVPNANIVHFQPTAELTAWFDRTW